LHAFDYRRPQTVAEAASAPDTVAGSKILAGGRTLIPNMKNRLARPEELADLVASGALKAIRTQNA
jgi:carbon-monoxide dehydrogenase medium subunit